jgi:hypothetical protein
MKGECFMNDELMMEYYKSSIDYITNDLKDLAQRYVRLGFHLHEVDVCKYYLFGGYSNVYDFAENEFGLKRSTVSRCVNIYFKFSDSGHIYIDKKYEKFNYSQLCEMLSIKDDAKLRLIRPEMSIKEIRKIKSNEVVCKDYVNGERIIEVSEGVVIQQDVLCDVAQSKLYCRCGYELYNDWNYCPMCGMKLFEKKMDNDVPGQYEIVG